MVLVLSDEEVASLIDLPSLAPVVEDALVSQGRGEVERPDRPHYDIGTGLDGPEPLGMGLAMPAYIHGEPHFATKLVGVNEGNADRGLPTIHAQVVLADARTGQPVSFMNGGRITNARTGCIGGLAARDLAPSGPVRVGVLGAGTQARWQTRAIAALCDVDSVKIYSPSDSREDCAADLRDHDIPAEAVDSAEAAVQDATVVVTATTSTEPVFPADTLAPGTLVVAVGAYTGEMQELESAVFDRAARVFADVPEEVAEIGDLLATDLTEDDLIPLSAVFEGDAGRESDDEILVVESVGTAVLDAATAADVYESATEAGIGTEQSF
ncbi:ornithine cyclodeaminase family protein [Haloarchaeobius sp. HME9146]|uniref:ornithine cyclodeaminase family protein n=1 Tax=Haloarchaeobius sp. HME9146 TaxID=2978732 RepID=UPI0021C1D3FE|nr:ornithine cyclodeaminase family protein [Haloarchaeobius sp. HME9146]MCT9094966.1 ornithine cyclodeaminase family protein [Haloarchaeobius sp. HME9146]